MAKVHFMADPAGDKNLYRVAINTIRSLGHTVISEHCLKQTKEKMESETVHQYKTFRKNAERWISQADLVIFDGTTPTLALGYEVGLSLVVYRNPTIVLYNEAVGGLTLTAGHGFKALDDSEVFLLIPYRPDTLSDVVKDALRTVNLKKGRRYHLILPKEIDRYLFWISRKQSVDMAAYVRRLIYEDMEQNRQYQQYLEDRA